MIISKLRDKIKFHINPENINEIMINYDFCTIIGLTIPFEAKQKERSVGV